MLSADDEQSVAAQFGVARAQVRRDHLISHLLAAISTHLADDVLFFGGTALSRTVAPDGRLSEDIDLIALTSRQATADTLQTTAVRAIRREYPDLRWQPRLTDVNDTQPAVLTSTDTSVRIQLLDRVGYSPWPTEKRPIVQRYTDAPPASLIVPTTASFAAWKTSTWADRSASRDLFDLWLLANRGAITSEAADRPHQVGPGACPTGCVSDVARL
jgi:predicted nucleotidyltransferase component of viral defense system